MSIQKDNRNGHRNRLRTRLTKAGRTAFADHELLELLLTYAIPRKDTKQLAKNLIDRFGSFAAVLDQPKECLLQIEGIGPQTSVFLSAVRASLTRYLEQKVENARTISKPEDVAEFLRVHLGANQRECLMILCLNDANRLVHHDTVIEGTVNRAPFYPREVIKTALMHNATGLIMVHNHPKIILSKAFRGKLLPQDPNDEPASVLLRRIIESLDKKKPIEIQRKAFGLDAHNMMNYKEMIA